MIDDLVDVALADVRGDLERPKVAAIARVGDDVVVRPLVGALREMKTLGATWDHRLGAWKLPAARMHVRAALEVLGRDSVQLDPSAEALLKTPRWIVDDPRLYDFQRLAAGRLVGSPRGQILVMSPGLGKTATSIVAAEQVTDDQVVVVSPSKLMFNWRREIARWAQGDSTTAIVHGDPDWDEVRSARWLITTWDALARHQDWFAGRWPLWILDESVLAKSRKSARSMGVGGGTRRKKKIAADGTETIETKRWDNMRKNVERVWLLSGSPTTRYSDDLWSQLKLVWPRAFPSYWRFAERYCVVEESVWARTVVGDRRDRRVVEDNSDLIYVVNQEDVLDLPEYLFEAVDVELTPKQGRAYQDMLTDFVALLDSGEEVTADNRIAQLVRLQQIASYWQGESAKHDALVALLETYESPHLIWTHWVEGANALTERLEKAGVRVAHVRGGMSPKVSDAMIEDYKAGRIDALVISVGTGKFGHTLTNTRTIHWVDKTWNADDYFQAMRRVRRIGLVHKPLSVSYRAPGTTDDLLELNLEGKLPSIASVTSARLRELLLGLGKESVSA